MPDDLRALVSLFTREMGRSPSMGDMAFLPVIKISVLNGMLVNLLQGKDGDSITQSYTADYLVGLLQRYRQDDWAGACTSLEFSNTISALEAEDDDLPRYACMEYEEDVLRSLSSVTMSGAVRFPPDCALIARWILQIR